MSGLNGSVLRIIVLLVIAGVARADLSLAGERVALDALVWTGAHWWRAEHAGFAQNEFAFDRVGAIVGLTGQLSPVISARTSGDVGNVQPLDVYVDLGWPSGFGLRAGQFRPPLGMDATAEPESLKLAGSSFLAGYAKPAGVRDIGILGRWEQGAFSVVTAAVNGAGANAGDNNDRKDLCGRVAVRPLAALDAVFALRAYYGWPDALDSLWRTVAFEARLRRGPFELEAELQNHQSQYSRNNMAHVQAAWDFGLVEPVGRFDIFVPQGKRTDWMAVGGLNLQPLPEHLRVMFDCSYHRDNQNGWSVLGFHFQLQAAI
jgi:hypothetical protein